MKFATQQEEALQKIEHWYHETDEQVFRLFGYAGTGKTTTASIAAERLGLNIGSNVIAVAYTGKAAYVLQRKQLKNSQTIHKLIYQPRDKARDHLNGLVNELFGTTHPTERLQLEQEIAKERKRLETPDFLLVSPMALSHLDLIIVDEVSMIDDKIAKDLLSFGTRILALGDPMQLPPIDGPGYFMREKPDYLLTDIHRTNVSEIVNISMNIRLSQPNDNQFGCPVVSAGNGRLDEDTKFDFTEYEQIIVGTNATRWRLNRKIRELRGMTSDWPQATDRIVVISNSSDAMVFNGQQFEVVSQDKSEYDRILLTVKDELDEARSLWVWKDGFISAQQEREARKKGRGPTAAATWGYAITAHKAQGSEWDRVLVVDETKVLAGMKFKENNKEFGFEKANNMYYADGRQWLYTSVTRAISQVNIISIINTW